MTNIEQINRLQTLLDFLDELERHHLHFKLERHRSETIMVLVNVPGERWEVEFFGDGEIEVEVFRSSENGVVGGDEAQAALRHLIDDIGEL